MQGPGNMQHPVCNVADFVDPISFLPVWLCSLCCNGGAGAVLAVIAPSCGMLQGHLGPAPDCGAHLGHAQLGDGVQKVVPGLQAADLLRLGQGAQGSSETAGPSPTPSTSASPPTPSSCRSALTRPSLCSKSVRLNSRVLRASKHVNALCSSKYSLLQWSVGWAQSP